MKFYEDENNVQEYIQMCEGFDGKWLIDKLSKYLFPISTVLELGMGPGTDLKLLNNIYTATGSDNSQIFLDIYLKSNPNADILLLDAVNLETNRKFDCIYSNKVLHHLSKDKLDESLSLQSNVLEKNGIILHTFWHGNKEETIRGMKFYYYNKSILEDLFCNQYEILEINTYEEMEKDDSIYVIARMR